MSEQHPVAYLSTGTIEAQDGTEEACLTISSKGLNQDVGIIFDAESWGSANLVNTAFRVIRLVADSHERKSSFTETRQIFRAKINFLSAIRKDNRSIFTAAKYLQSLAKQTSSHIEQVFQADAKAGEFLQEYVC